jgi:hypothetical protein
MRTLAPLPAEAKAVIVEGQPMYLSYGMQRSYVILRQVRCLALAEKFRFHAFDQLAF